jgi:hypothetical protein
MSNKNTRPNFAAAAFGSATPHSKAISTASEIESRKKGKQCNLTFDDLTLTQIMELRVALVSELGKKPSRTSTVALAIARMHEKYCPQGKK